MSTVPPYGSKEAKIAFVGDAPGTVENRKGEPFHPEAPAGGLLADCMLSAGLIRDDIYFTNVFKFMVTKSYDKNKLYHGEECVYDVNKGFTEAGLVYRNELLTELNDIHANVIVAFGNPALEALRGHRQITKWRGSILEATNLQNRKMIPAIHPSNALTTYLTRYEIIYDLRKAVREMEFPEINRPKREYILEPSLNQVRAFFDEVDKRGGATIDLEVINQEISCCGIGWKDKVLVIPFVWDSGNYWSEEDEAKVWSLINDFVSDPTLEKILQNAMFDLWVLARNNHIIYAGPIHDTMIAQWVLYTDFPKGLDYIASVHTEMPYYKDDGKQWFKSPGSFTTLWNYNASDVACTHEAYLSLQRQLVPPWRQLYEDRINKLHSSLFMQMRGILADRTKLSTIREELIISKEEKQKELDELCGCEMNVNSSKQLQTYFYVTKGVKPYINRKSGAVTVDDKALQRLARPLSSRPGFKEATLIQEIRSLRKLESTYLGIEFDPDSRLRCALNVVGTNTGRFSTSQTLFGTGANMQNLPQSFKRLLVADPGKVLINCDKRQAEWVVVAYLAQDARMIETIKSGKDIHLETAHLAFGIPHELIIAEAELIGHSTDAEEIADLRLQIPELATYDLPHSMSIRQAGKKSNHAFNYGMGPGTFSSNNSIAENEANLIYEAYHNAYPGIRSTFHKYVKRCLEKSRILYNLYGDPRRFADRWDYKLWMDAYAHIPQSTVARVVSNAQAILYDSPLKVLKSLELLMNEHDALLHQYPIANLTHLAETIFEIKDAMNPSFTFEGQTFSIGTDVSIGLNWGEVSKDNPFGVRPIHTDCSVEELKNILATELAKMSI